MMNDEIREILDIERYRNKDGYVENISVMPDEIHKLLDYITNLQQEKEDYKSRIEKAVEYFKYQLENLDFYEDTKARMLCAMGITLLQNGSDNNE